MLFSGLSNLEEDKRRDILLHVMVSSLGLESSCMCVKILIGLESSCNRVTAGQKQLGVPPEAQGHKEDRADEGQGDRGGTQEERARR